MTALASSLGTHYTPKSLSDVVSIPAATKPLKIRGSMTALAGARLMRWMGGTQ